MKQIIFSIFFLFSFTIDSQILFSEYAEGTSYNKYLEVYNYSSITIDLTQYGFPSCSNGCDVDGEWDYMNYFPDGATLEPGDVFVITHPFATDSSNDYYTEEIAIHSDHQFTYLSNGDDVFALINIETGNILDIIGAIGPDPGNGWEVAGVTDATKDHTLLRKSDVSIGNSGDWSSSAGTNENDSEWIVLDNENWENLGFHDFSGSTNVLGCTDSEALNYNPDATIDDGSCEYEDVLGCTDLEALNYNPDATIDDGSCEYSFVLGCADQTACNYDPLADNSFFMYGNTDSNMTIALEYSVGSSAGLESGDEIGVFYLNSEGALVCGGSAQWNNKSVALAAWGTESGLDNGFDVGEGFAFIIQKNNGAMFYTTSSMNTSPPFSSTYMANGLGQITELIITDPYLDEVNCTYPIQYYDCDGDCINDADGDGICDEFELFLEDENLINLECIKIVDLIGRDVHEKKYNNILFKLFNDGSVSKVVIIK